VASGTLTPFKLPNLLSQLQIPRTKSSGTTVPPAQTHSLARPRLTQGRSTGRRDHSEGRALVEVVEVVQRLQERVAYLEGHPSEERARNRRRQRTSTPSQGEDTVESEGTVDPPPTYSS
jgi:hypothetical protein